MHYFVTTFIYDNNGNTICFSSTTFPNCPKTFPHFLFYRTVESLRESINKTIGDVFEIYGKTKYSV